MQYLKSRKSWNDSLKYMNKIEQIAFWLFSWAPTWLPSCHDSASRKLWPLRTSYQDVPSSRAAALAKYEHAMHATETWHKLKDPKRWNDDISIYFYIFPSSYNRICPNMKHSKHDNTKETQNSQQLSKRFKKSWSKTSHRLCHCHGDPNAVTLLLSCFSFFVQYKNSKEKQMLWRCVTEVTLPWLLHDI